MAKLYFNYSTMNAGKSTVLLQASHNYIERGMQTYLLTAQLDDRAGHGRIESRIGIGEAADTFAAGQDLFARIRTRLAEGPCACVFVDEAQFLEPAQVWQLARAVDDLNVPVMCFGLRSISAASFSPDRPRFWRWLTRCGRSARSVIAARRPRWLCARVPMVRS